MTGGPTGRLVRSGPRGDELANVVSPPHGDTCQGQCRPERPVPTHRRTEFPQCPREHVESN